IVVKGTAGVYENPKFAFGTKKILEAVKNTDAFNFICGGDTSVALNNLGLDPDDFNHVSIAGGAMITYLSGKKLPGIEALKT
ncbi:phosphoglycerate kinase, partial [Candidatus Bathyarchaeota archaeon]|nr:phosphoglycerate kinase [Candidatus Bathyarchaeota archaeon]